MTICGLMTIGMPAAVAAAAAGSGNGKDAAIGIAAEVIGSAARNAAAGIVVTGTAAAGMALAGMAAACNVGTQKAGGGGSRLALGTAPISTPLMSSR